MRKASVSCATEEPRCVYSRMRFYNRAARLSKETARTGLFDCHFDEEFIREIAADLNVLDAVGALNGPNELPSSTHFFEE